MKENETRNGMHERKERRTGKQKEGLFKAKRGAGAQGEDKSQIRTKYNDFYV